MEPEYSTNFSALEAPDTPLADCPGRWVCLTQRFVLVKKSGAGGRAVR
jgi:hypothetical protein